jgi:dehydrogenase/reductase SDR family protein 7B
MTKRTYYWVTGASSGIGEAICSRLASPENVLVLSARNEEKLQLLSEKLSHKGCECHVIPLDLSDEQSIGQALKHARNTLPKINYLINNGGVSQRSLVLETTMETTRRLFEINFFGTIRLSREVLSWMLETGGGNISVVSSIAGKFGFPERSAYSAAKHAQVGFFETLGLEYGNQNIHTTLIFPGRVKTEISKNALKGDGQAHMKMDDGQAKGISADKCAQKIIRAIQKNKHQVYIGGSELLMVFFRKFIPPLFRRIASTAKN